jgi:acyl carrier protein
VREDAATRDAFDRALIDFITTLVRTRTKTIDGAFELDASTPLFETGLIDSLGVLELLAFLEAHTGRPIPIHKVDVAFFRTVACISRTFWRGAEEQAV